MRQSFLVVMLALVGASCYAAPLTLEQLNQKLSRSSDKWIAGETRVSKLSETERKRLLGAELPRGFNDYFVSTAAPTMRAPANLDWRNMNGVSYTAPVLNQGSCGSCVAFAAITTLETQLNITRKTPYSPWAFSPQHLFACGGGACERGWQPYSAAEYLKTKGVPDEACFPYKSGATGKDLACSETCSTASNRLEKIVGYTVPTFFFMNAEAIKNALQKGPLMTVMSVYEDFLFYKGGVYKHTTGAMAGGHAVTLVGWNDAEKAWIVKNSWGEDWGENGYFRIAYDDASGLGSQSFAFEVAGSDGYVTLGDVRDYQVFTGKVKVKLDTNLNGAEELTYTLSNGQRVVASGVADSSQIATLDTTQHADGVYMLQAVATSERQMIKSQERIVYLLNGKFNGTAKITNLTAGQTVTEQTKLAVETQASPVPFTKLTFTAKNVATGEETKRYTQNPTSKMEMLWRAQLLANGEYDVWLEGKVGSIVTQKMPVTRVTIQHP